MIAAAGIEDQELAVIAERPGIDHPAVAGCGDLGARTGRHGETLFGASDAVRSAKLLDSDPVDRQRNPAFGGGEGDGRHQAAGIVEGGEIRTSFASLVLAGAPIAARGPRTLLELCNQVLEAVGL